MQEKIYVVSRFLRRRNRRNEFHFIGYFDGNKVRKILVEGGEFEENIDYVLAITNIVYNEQNEQLVGSLIKSKKIFTQY